MSEQAALPRYSTAPETRSRQNNFTEAQLRRTIKAARDIDPNVTIEVIIGSATVRLLPKGNHPARKEPSTVEGLLPKQW